MPESLAPRLLTSRPCCEGWAFSQSGRLFQEGSGPCCLRAFSLVNGYPPFCQKVNLHCTSPVPGLWPRVIREKAHSLTLLLCSLRCHPCLWAL